MAQSDSNNSSGRGATRSALIIVGVLALLGLAYAIARVDILRARIVTQEIALQGLQDSHDSLRGQAASLNGITQDNNRQIAQLQTRLESLSSNFGELRTQAEQAQRLSTRSEALYLLRLANSQLQLAHDRVGAIDTLNAAEKLLIGSHDASLQSVLTQVQNYLRQLRARPGVDTALIQQQLAAAEQQASTLPLAGIGLQAAEMTAALPDSGWARAWAVLKRGLTSLFSIRKAGTQAAAMLSRDEQALHRRHLQLLLMNARLAAHAHDQTGFVAAVRDATGWLDQAFDMTNPAVSGLKQQLQQLAGQDIAPPAPDLAPSIQTLSRYLPGPAGVSTP